MKINWNDDLSLVFFNPVLQGQDYIAFALQHQKEYSNQIWVSTSGTTGINKWVGISRAALLASAEAVNEHLKSTSNDIWLHALPEFHVGGIGIWARAYLSNSSVVDIKNDQTWKWNPKEFYEAIIESKATLTSLVPTQVYDLLQLNLTSPDSLRAVIVGGDAIPNALLQKGRDMGWRLLPSYGMTECSSQIATAKLEDSKPDLQLLKHVEVKVQEDGRLNIKSPALLTCYAYQTEKGIEFHDPKVEGWFLTEDTGEVSNGYLKVLGRFGNIVKIGGEKVNLFLLEQKLQNLIDGRGIQAVLNVSPDDRLGNMISLVVEKATANPLTVEKLLQDFHQEVLPYEKIRFIRYVEKIPRSPLGKPLARSSN